MNKIIEQFEAEQITRQLPEFGPGDTVVVNVKVKEGNRERVQAFEGVVIAKRSRGLHSAFTVRKISHGTGVERVFQAHSPAIDSVDSEAQGQGARRQAVLPARPGRQGRPHQGRHCRRLPPPRLRRRLLLLPSKLGTASSIQQKARGAIRGLFAFVGCSRSLGVWCTSNTRSRSAPCARPFGADHM